MKSYYEMDIHCFVVQVVLIMLSKSFSISLYYFCSLHGILEVDNYLIQEPLKLGYMDRKNKTTVASCMSDSF